MRKPIVAVVTGVATAALALGGQPVANANHKPVDIRVLTTQVGAPFNIHVASNGIYVADGGPGIVGKIRRDGSIRTLVRDAPGASGVAYKHGRLAWTTTVTNEETFENTASALHIRSRHGTVHANTLRFERRHNPDQVRTYGIDHPTQCQREGLGPQVKYRGLVDSHAYSVASWRGKWLVADAGANNLLVVDRRGHMRNLAVLPRQPVTITAESAAALGLDPECFDGVTYNFESVPTDVEVGRNGWIYVTTLPGGPEGPELGARGAVYKINPWSGATRLVARGFAGATNLAIGNNGRLFVSELFGGRISMIVRGRIQEYVELPGAVAVDSRRHGLWAATLDFSGGPGSVVRIR